MTPQRLRSRYKFRTDCVVQHQKRVAKQAKCNRRSRILAEIRRLKRAKVECCITFVLCSVYLNPMPCQSVFRIVRRESSFYGIMRNLCKMWTFAKVSKAAFSKFLFAIQGRCKSSLDKFLNAPVSV